MGGDTDLKRRKMLKLLSWLSTQESFVVSTGGRHQWVVKHEKWQRPFAVPFKHNTINKFIVKALMDKVVSTGVCTREDFEQRLK